MKMIFKNKHGMVRSGWIIALCMAAFYALGYAFSALLIDALRMILDAASLDAASYDALVDWMSASVLPVALQFLTEGIMLAVPLAAWRIMRYRWEDLGLRDFRARFKKDGVVGMALGFAACSAIFLLLLAAGNVVVEGVNSPFSLSLFAWVLVFVAVGIAEEVMNRGFIMSVLRRTNSRFLVIVVPSLIFGLIHLTNPNVTLLSVVNIVLLGIALSLMYYKSGNVWMCIGFHIAWNLFQSVVYGMPVSGLDVPRVPGDAYPVGNLLNGGGFGIEACSPPLPPCPSWRSPFSITARPSIVSSATTRMRRRARRRSGRTRRLPRFDRRRGPVSYGTRPIPLSSSSRNLPAIWDDGAHARLNDACCHCQSTAAPLEDRGLEPLREASSVAQAITVTDIRKNFGAVEAPALSLDVARGESRRHTAVRLEAKSVPHPLHQQS